MRSRSSSTTSSRGSRRQGPDSATGERRWSVRQPQTAVGVISYQGERFSTSCNVLDMSLGGARLELDFDDWVNPITSTRALPSCFKLMVPSLGVEADCAVAWRDKDAIGVRFVGRLRVMPRQFRKLRTFRART